VSAFFLSKNITTPMHELYLCMRKVGQGDFSPQYPSTSYNELQYLISRFQKMVNEIDRLIETVARKESETAEAELEALQAKINPHFLYNTLDVIRGMAMENNDHRIADMTLSLSRLFRYNVNELGEVTTIKREILHIKDYIKIQSHRFGDRIKVEWNLNKDLEEAKIIRFVFQPIVENAFKHGLELKGKGGILIITVDQMSDSLIVTVEDNGAGIDPSQLKEMKKNLKSRPNISRIKAAHGLENVNLRIQLTYGINYGIDIESQLNQGTIIKVTVPLTLE
jgi:two-component system sensor histidine kinase YesM